MSKPKDIEELSGIKQKISEIPMILIKKQQEIDKCVNIYEILEDFQYKFGIGDLDRRWTMVGMPKHIEEVVEERKVDLEKEQEVFQEDMEVK